MLFRGWRHTSLIEYPGRVSTVLFCGGCNFRCPFCYNTDLVLRPGSLPAVEGEEVLRHLAGSRALYQAVVVTGGEPTLDEGLAGFLAAVRRLGLSTGLESNGSRPAVLRDLLGAGLLDYVGLDVKAPLEEEAYARAAGLRPAPLREVEESLDLLLAAPIEVEFRTTVVAALHAPEDLLAIGRRLRGARRYVLQRFLPGNTLDQGFRRQRSLLRPQLLAVQAELGRLVGTCEVRNL